MIAGKRFIDSLKFFVKAGSGGNGIPKFGGVGGKGGDVYVSGAKGITLQELKYSKKIKCIAHNGADSRQHRLIGDNGADVTIDIPCGTEVCTNTGNLLGEILQPHEAILVARGGSGGNSTNHFIGQKGEERFIHFFLKLIADIGLVGFPNAGKSTLLRAISHAKPKIANYPFTTLQPMVGIIHYDDLRTIAMADLPGLIEGAWCNIGMGHKFLRHVERTQMLVFVVDIEGFRLGPTYPYRSPIENIILLNKELELYKPDLLEKPCILLINKMDKPNAVDKFLELKHQLRDYKATVEAMPEEIRPEILVNFNEVLPCSAKKDKDSIKLIKEKIRILLDAFSIKDDNLESLHNQIKSDLYDTQPKLI